MKRYVLQLRGSHSGAVMPVPWMDFSRRREAEDWIAGNDSMVQLTTYEIIDRGSLWQRFLRTIR